MDYVNNQDQIPSQVISGVVILGSQIHCEPSTEFMNVQFIDSCKNSSKFRPTNLAM